MPGFSGLAFPSRLPKLQECIYITKLKWKWAGQSFTPFIDICSQSAIWRWIQPAGGAEGCDLTVCIAREKDKIIGRRASKYPSLWINCGTDRSRAEQLSFIGAFLQGKCRWTSAQGTVRWLNVLIRNVAGLWPELYEVRGRLTHC